MPASIEIEGFEKAIKELKQFEHEVRTKALTNGLRAAGKVVVKKARQLAPDGLTSGNSRKKSKKQEASKSKRLRKGLKVKVKHYPEHTIAIAGADYSKAPHAHLVEQGHEKVLWGKPTGARVEGKEFFATAADTTKSEQESALLDELRKPLQGK